MSIRVTDTKVFGPGHLDGKPATPPSANPAANAGEMPDRSLEADDVRVWLKDNEGYLCIGIQPGAELGEIFVNVQFEGPKGQYNRCMDGQNQALATTSAWMEEIIGSLGGEYTAEIESEPCPKATTPVAIEHASAILESVESVMESRTQAELRSEMENRHSQ